MANNHYKLINTILLSLHFRMPAIKHSREFTTEERERKSNPARWRAQSCQPPTRGSYQRYPKPPYSYLGMMVTAILNSPKKQLTLAEIHHSLENMFPFFRGGYIGWKDSVRHNLSHNKCFVKVLKDPGNPNAKGNFWRVDLAKVPTDAFRRQDTVVSREHGFAYDLRVELGLPPVLLGNTTSPPIGQHPQLERVQTTPPSPDGRSFTACRDSYRETTKPVLSFSVDAILKQDNSVHKASLQKAKIEGATHASSWLPRNSVKYYSQIPNLYNVSDVVFSTFCYPASTPPSLSPAPSSELPPSPLYNYASLTHAPRALYSTKTRLFVDTFSRLCSSSMEKTTTTKRKPCVDFGSIMSLSQSAAVSSC